MIERTEQSNSMPQKVIKNGECDKMKIISIKYTIYGFEQIEMRQYCGTVAVYGGQQGKYAEIIIIESIQLAQLRLRTQSTSLP